MSQIWPAVFLGSIIIYFAFVGLIYVIISIIKEWKEDDK